MSLNPKLSPNGLSVVTQEPGKFGHDWLDDIRTAWYRGNGPGIYSSDGQIDLDWPEPDSITVGGGAVAANYWNATVKGITHSSGLVFPGGFHGSLSDTGQLVYLTGHGSTQQVVRDTQATEYDSGAAMERPCACNAGPAWSRYEGGRPRTYYADWGRTKRRVHASGDLAEFRPVPAVTPLGVWIGTTTHNDARCYPVGSTEGFIFPSVNAQNLDVKWNGIGLRMVWNEPDAQGVLRFRDEVIDLSKPRVPLNVPIVVPPPPPPPPPQIPKVTISSYLPTSGPAPLRVRAVAVLSGGKAKQLWWRWKRQGGSWNLAVKNPATDLDHTYTNFTTPGIYYIGVDVTDLSGKVTNGTQQERKVTVT